MLLAAISPVPFNGTDNSTTETTHTMVTTHSMASTESSTSGKIVSTTIQPHNVSDNTSSIPTSSITHYTATSDSSVSVTTAPSTPTTPCPPQTGFDAASFVGGIILALGVMVILVIVVKCYQSRVSKTELQYSQF